MNVPQARHLTILAPLARAAVCLGRLPPDTAECSMRPINLRINLMIRRSAIKQIISLRGDICSPDHSVGIVTDLPALTSAIMVS